MHQLLLPVNMKLSTILASALATLAIAIPTTNKREASPQPESFLDMIRHSLELPDIPLQAIYHLKQCLRTHKTYHTDYRHADEGVLTVSNVDHICCEQAKEIWNDIPEGQYGHAIFTKSCDGVTIAGISKEHMELAREFLDNP